MHFKLSRSIISMSLKSEKSSYYFHVKNPRKGIMAFNKDPHGLNLGTVLKCFKTPDFSKMKSQTFRERFDGDSNLFFLEITS